MPRAQRRARRARLYVSPRALYASSDISYFCTFETSSSQPLAEAECTSESAMWMVYLRERADGATAQTRLARHAGVVSAKHGAACDRRGSAHAAWDRYKSFCSSGVAKLWAERSLVERGVVAKHSGVV